MAYTITSSIDISANAVAVWKILKDFPRYGEWNPFIRSIEGSTEIGSKLNVFLQPSGTKGMRFKPTLLEYSENRRMRWLGRLWIPRLFDGEHSFSITDNPDGSVKFVQQETFRGILVPLFKRSLEKDTERGFEEMNRALRARSEKVD